MALRETDTRTRRRLLASIGATLGAVALAGCTGTGGDDSGEESPVSSGDSRETEEGPADGEQPGNGGDTDPSNGSGGDSDPSDGGGDESDCAGGSVHESYDETAVTVTTPAGEQLGSVTAAIAATTETQRIGLSEVDCLPPDRGMLFVYERNQSLGFWMRNMEIGIDIVHIDSEGVITSIQHAEAPAADEDGTEERHQYPGTGQFVLEVNYNWTTEHGVEAGDIVTFDL